MTTLPRLPLALASLASVPLALVLIAATSRADLGPSPPVAARAPVAAASASPAATSASPAAASVAASASAQASSEPPVISDDPPAEEKSKAPTAAEWKEAARMSLDRSAPYACEARRVREWVRLTCTRPASQVRVVAGPTEGFSASIGHLDNRGETLKGSYNIQFPVRRGEHRIYEVSTVVTGGYDDSLFPQIDYLLVSSWVPGEAPVVLTQR